MRKRRKVKRIMIKRGIRSDNFNPFFVPSDFLILFLFSFISHSFCYSLPQSSILNSPSSSILFLHSIPSSFLLYSFYHFSLTFTSNFQFSFTLPFPFSFYFLFFTSFFYFPFTFLVL